MQNLARNGNTYWCHQCSKLIEPQQPNICPECHTDFVERIDPDEDDRPESFVRYESPRVAPVMNHPNPPIQHPLPFPFMPAAFPVQTMPMHHNFIFMDANQPPNANPNANSSVNPVNPFASIQGMLNQFLGPALGVHPGANLGDYAFGRNFDQILERMFQQAQG
eukprot:TRINITY_DN8431_c0_g1_i3.p1 TRINITY_DN8431_c0_g1~~TRINITY_DN8431_c0_g1_i3.p1  ORF type:complete len:164 (-),score=24.94 TRINITY_DN8431_c0_g1_i3:642-1133(-)